MKFIELVTNLKQKIVPLYNIKGEDAFLVRQAITNIKRAVVTGLEEFNYTKLDADKMKANELNAIISTLPISSEHRLVVLNNPNAEIVKALNKYEFSDNSTVVVTVNADKLSNCEVVDCSKLDRVDIQNYILNVLNKNNLLIQEQALDYLIDATNGNMSFISTELNKLVSFAINKGTITVDMVTNLVANTTEYAVFLLTNAIDAKDYAKYQTVLNELNKTNTANELFSYMGKYFRRMQYICLNKNDDELAKILNIKPYAIKMSRQAISKNGVNYYINLYQKYIELDYKIKSGKIAATNALYELIF